MQSTFESHNIDYIKNPDLFFEICQKVLNHHVPRKKKYIRGNNKTFMTKALSKAIMQRTRFRNKFLKNPATENRLIYNRQRKFCLSLLRKDKREYFASLNEKDITDNRLFWHIVKPFLSDKIKSRENITLVNNENITSKEVEVANTLSNFFSTIIKSLKIPEYYAQSNLPPNLSRHPTLKAILKYKNHPSISIVKRFSERFSSYHFSQVDKNTVLKEITKLSLNKSVQDTDIPVKILKENTDYFAEHICLQFNETICSSKFPASLKFANVTPVFKQGSRNQKDNYRPISILPIISKVFEKLIRRQLSNHFDNILSKFQCGFRKGYSQPHYLHLLIDK